jgi:Sec-independent protein translocase protein TatA
MLGLGAEELLLVAVLGFLLFSPAEIVAALRKLQVWKVTAHSWAKGMWAGW